MLPCGSSWQSLQAKMKEAAAREQAAKAEAGN